MKEKSYKTKLLNSIIRLALKQLPKAQHKLADIFVNQFYQDVEWSDFENRSEEELVAAVLAFWKIFYKRKPHEFKIKVFNPVLDKDGWEGANTVIAIIIDDMPFVMDSLQMQLNRMGLAINIAIGLGGLKIERNSKGCVTEIIPIKDRKATASIEGPIYIEIDKKLGVKESQALQIKLEKVLHEVKSVVRDRAKIKHKIYESIQDIKSAKDQLNVEDAAEITAFLQWLNAGNFIFLGYRKYKVVFLDKEYALQVIPQSNLGLLKRKKSSLIHKYYSELPKKAQQFIFAKYPLILSKTDTISTVHRPAYTDSIIVKCYNNKGDIVAAHRFIGLYASTLYHSNLRNIPLLRDKLEKILDKFGYPRNDYTSKTLFHILETLPRDDFLQAQVKEFYQIATSIFRLQGRRVIRLFVYEELYRRYVSCLVYIPRDNFNTDVRMRIQKYLVKAFNGINSTFNVLFSESILARIHFVIRIKPHQFPNYNVKAIEQELIAISSSWYDKLRDCLLEKFNKKTAAELFSKYAQAFSAGYMENFSAKFAVADIEQIEKLNVGNALGMLFYQLPEVGSDIIQLKLFHFEQNVKLSDTLPILENFSFKVIGEQSYKIVCADKIVWVNDFSMEAKGSGNIAVKIKEIEELFKETFKKIWYDEATNDGFNSLVLMAKLNWREVTVLRAGAKYLRQIGFPFDRKYLELVITRYYTLAKLLVEIFRLKFSPELKGKCQNEVARLCNLFNRKLNRVKSLEEEGVLCQFLAIINAMLRTNYYQNRPYLSFKFDCSKIPKLPLPYPLFEIFTYAPRFEGVHLRMAKVARGGIRWSDRHEDFRTEILGLMKAQQVKNVVIVPYGAKGGFILKKIRPNWDQDQLQQEAVVCYKNFISSLLDITDNIVNNKIVRPRDVICYDDLDPYLVVAADKGTASFSDIANGIAAEYNFWLKDGFASGGAAGYDHKKIGITARGVWESVKYNFYELGINVNETDFTVVGIGDMGGDVFGNGMLLSEHIKLIGAFNHSHIFIDTDPDPKNSFKERRRLFNLPQSNWEDYNPKIISKGGGVFRRTAKSIKLSSEIRKRLNISKKEITSNELIKALLQAPVDLLWNGGIGTYIKASYEKHADVGDRDNDAVRINANELCCKVVAEGGNLGLTQLARVEYSLQGGIVNADFIDNSAGVDCSDHEVNIKILLNALVQAGKLSKKARDQLLVKMTPEVTKLVLYNNYRQVRAISLLVVDSIANIDIFAKHLNYLENIGLVNRKLEFLPNNKILRERKALKQGLTRPEIAILLAYSKIIVKAEILNSKFPGNKYFIKYLYKEFPVTLCKNFYSDIQQHKLRREIISTQLGNDFITNLGITFFYEMQKEIPISLTEIICAYVIANEICDFTNILSAIESLDFKIAINLQKQLVAELRSFIINVIKWLSLNVNLHDDIENIIMRFKDKFLSVAQQEELLLKSELKNINLKIEVLIKSGVSKNIATYIATRDFKYEMLNVVKIAIDNNFQVFAVAKRYFDLRDYLKIALLLEKIDEFAEANSWASTACSTLKNDLNKQQCFLTTRMLRLAKTAEKISSKKLIQKLVAKQQALFEHWQNMMSHIAKSNNVNFETLYLAVHEILRIR